MIQTLKPKVAVICSTWHSDIVFKARDAIVDEIARKDSSNAEVELFEVPGAFEIPLFAKKLAKTGRYDGIIACGLVVNGGIYRHDFVAAAVIDALMKLQMDSEVPVFSSVLTPRDFHEHEDHNRFFSDHFVKKGTEVARACLETLGKLKGLE